MARHSRSRRPRPRNRNIAYEIDPTTPVGEIAVQEFDRTILEGPNITENVIVKGAGSVGTSGAVGAVDRITHEILLSLDERPTLVVWLFDQSGSLKPQREAIAKRFDRVYQELGMIEAVRQSRRSSSTRTSRCLPPSPSSARESNCSRPSRPSDLDEIKSSVRAIRDDPDGKGQENVFQSVQYLAEKFRHHRLASPRRNVMIVVFTDEAGDDVAVSRPGGRHLPQVRDAGVCGRRAGAVRPDDGLRQIRRSGSEVRSVAAMGARASGPRVAAAGADLMLLFGGTAEEEEPGRFRLRAVRIVPAGVRNGRALFHGASEPQSRASGFGSGKRRPCRRISRCSSIRG